MFLHSCAEHSVDALNLEILVLPFWKPSCINSLVISSFPFPPFWLLELTLLGYCNFCLIPKFLIFYLLISFCSTFYEIFLNLMFLMSFNFNFWRIFLILLYSYFIPFTICFIGAKFSLIPSEDINYRLIFSRCLWFLCVCFGLLFQVEVLFKLLGQLGSSFMVNMDRWKRLETWCARARFTAGVPHSRWGLSADISLEHHYRWMFVSPQIICWNLNCQCDDVRRWGLHRWLGHEDGAPMKGISALI